MALRTFHNRDSREWMVWEVVPVQLEATTVVDREVLRGWLCFESGAEKRRLSPFPPGWQEMDEADLLQLWEDATPVAPTPARRWFRGSEG